MANKLRSTKLVKHNDAQGRTNHFPEGEGGSVSGISRICDCRIRGRIPEGPPPPSKSASDNTDRKLRWNDRLKNQPQQYWDIN